MPIILTNTQELSFPFPESIYPGCCFHHLSHTSLVASDPSHAYYNISSLGVVRLLRAPSAIHYHFLPSRQGACGQLIMSRRSPSHGWLVTELSRKIYDRFYKLIRTFEVWMVGLAWTEPAISRAWVEFSPKHILCQLVGYRYVEPNLFRRLFSMILNNAILYEYIPTKARVMRRNGDGVGIHTYILPYIYHAGAQYQQPEPCRYRPTRPLALQRCRATVRWTPGPGATRLTCSAARWTARACGTPAEPWCSVCCWWLPAPPWPP